MPAIIKSYVDLIPSKSIHSCLSSIFFESSTKKDFKNSVEKEAFHWKYLGFYLVNYPQYILLALKEDVVLGYVAAAPQTDTQEFYAIQPHLRVFTSYFLEFPAHLHINCHECSRGQGVGRELMEGIESRLKLQGSPGLHIMTGVDAPNRSFYQKLNYSFERTEVYNGASILLMGKTLWEKTL